MATVALLIVAGGCTPDIPQNAPPAAAIVVPFDPLAGVAPAPNDLVRDPSTGRVIVPPTPGESAAQREFEVDYLGTLTGFPLELPGQAGVGGDLDPRSVGTHDVLAFDLGTVAARSMTPASVVPAYVVTSRAIRVTPTSGSWTRGHTYAVVLVGGASGLRGAAGEDVIGSSTWALVSSSTPLVTCQDLTSSDCRPAVDVIPSDKTDPAQRLRDQTTTALGAERLRRLYAPVLDALEAKGIPRADVPIAWTFTTVDAGEVTFDPTHGAIPFPNDLLRPGGKVTLPNPEDTSQPLAPADCATPADAAIALACGLNTLDGFSTLTPPISEYSDTLGAVAQAEIDPASLQPASVGLAPIASKAPAWEQTRPTFTPCLNCLSSPDASGNPQTSPQQLQWKLDAPLDEQTTYVGYVTGDVVDTRGKPVIANIVFAMLRLANPLYDGAHSTVTLLTDAEAKQLEPLRLAMKPVIDHVGIARSKLALAFVFTTQSEGQQLDALYAYPRNPQLGLPDSPLYAVDATARFKQLAGAAGIPFAAIGKVFLGTFPTAVAVTGPGGTLDLTHPPRVAPVAFVLYVPAGAAPSSGYPLTIFGHDSTRSRGDSILLANALAAAGQATIASDVLLHGERSSCTGSAAVTKTTDDASCADPVAQKCNEDALIGRCVARDPGARAPCTVSAADPTGDLGCAARGQGGCVPADGTCEGGDFKRDATFRQPVISGWNLFSTTQLFGTRDALRQQVIDLSQLVRVARGQGASGLAPRTGVRLDPAKLGYVGQGLGGMLGTLFGAASPDAGNVALNTAGGALVRIVLESPAFATQRAALLGALAQLGANPGTPAFDRYLGIAQWVLDPADPVNVAYRLARFPQAPQRRAFLQSIEGDQAVPGDTSVALVAAASRSLTCVAPLYCYEFTEAGDGFDAASAVPSTRHGFLLLPPTGSRGLVLTMKAQQQTAVFLLTGELAP